MKKIYVSLLGVLLFGGCEKAKDYVKIDPCAEMNLCSIKSISYLGTANDLDTLAFSYNASGDPVSITRHQVATGFPNFAFKYDKKGRLTDFYAPNTFLTTAEFWHKYFYDNRDRIVIDSVYTMCEVRGASLASYYFASRHLLKYDVQNRIILDSVDLPPVYNPSVHHFAYDANGNLVGGSYDQKVSFRRTNKIWMFIDRNYSMNNGWIADAYNWYGLPTAFDFSIKGGYLQFLGTGFIRGKIAYTCN